MYQSGSYSSKTPVAIRSNIHYGTALSGKETVVNATTKTGLAPDIAKFEKYGLCCAGFVTYYICNYLPNIEGVNTQFITDSINATGWNSQAVATWQKALNNLVSSGQIEKIGTTANNVDRTKLTPGDLIVFGNKEDPTTHIAVYSGTYKDSDFMIHVGSDVGPEIMPVDWMSNSANGAKTSEPNGYYHLPDNIIQEKGTIEVYKKDTDGKVLSGVVFVATSTSDSNKQYVIGPTNSSGYAYADDVPYDTYEIKETVFPTNYRSYGRTKWNVTLNKSTPNGTVTINAVNELIPGSAKIVKTSEDGKVDGVSFRITGNGVDKTVKTANGGQITVNNLKPGVYTVTETVADKYTPQEAHRVAVVSGQTATVTFNNVLKRGTLTVTKTSEDGLNSGVKFHLYGTSLSGLAVDEYAVTDSSGKAFFTDVLIGTGYTLEEVDTAVRYVIPDKQTANIEWNTVTNKSFNNTLKKWKLTVTKSDSQTGTAQGDAKLSGAVYGVYKGEQLIDSYTTDKNGQFTTKYYVCGDDWTLREIIASEGYLLNTAKEHIGVEVKNYAVEYNTAVMDVTETVKKGKIALIKHADDGSTQIETPEENAEFKVYLKNSGSYENAKDSEKDIIVTDKYGYAETKALPYGVYTVQQTKGLDGKELMPPFDVFVSENGEVYRYLINNATFESLVEIVKKDAETSKVIPAANIGFKVRNTDTGEYVVQHINYPTPTDIEIYYTDTTGKLMLPEKLPFGNYEVIEQCTAYGYVLDNTPVAFKVDGSKTIVTVVKSNIAQKGIITVSKIGEVFSTVKETNGIYQPIYEIKGLAGAVFEVIAAEDIYTLDGTLRYAKGTVADTVTTGTDGTAKTKELYLGKYDIKEITAPYGMVLNGETKTVELTYAGQNIAVTSTSTEMFNERQKAIISLSKALEIDSKFGIGNNDEILSVRFGLYATEDMTAADGKVIPKDALLEIASCDKNGKIVFNTDIPVGAKVYVKEVATDSHYILSDSIYPVTFEYAGQNTETVEIAVNNGEEIENKIIRGNILGKKVDEDGFEIGGAVFGLFRADETEFTEDTAILISESNEIGVFAFSNVPYGKYVVREIKAAPAFVLNETNFEVTIDKDGKTVEIEVENKFITGELEITKTDIADGKTLEGVEFCIKDENGNIVFEGKTDKNGVLKATLRYGKYTYCETKALDGYYANDKEYEFEIKENGQIVKAIVTNEKIPVPDSPQTGDNSNIGFWITIMCLSFLALIGLCVYNRKTQNC